MREGPQPSRDHVRKSRRRNCESFVIIHCLASVPGARFVFQGGIFVALFISPSSPFSPPPLPLPRPSLPSPPIQTSPPSPDPESPRTSGKPPLPAGFSLRTPGNPPSASGHTTTASPNPTP